MSYLHPPCPCVCTCVFFCLWNTFSLLSKPISQNPQRQKRYIPGWRGSSVVKTTHLLLSQTQVQFPGSNRSSWTPTTYVCMLTCRQKRRIPSQLKVKSCEKFRFIPFIYHLRHSISVYLMAILRNKTVFVVVTDDHHVTQSNGHFPGLASHDFTLAFDIVYLPFLPWST